jgi:hypothetical protein
LVALVVQTLKLATFPRLFRSQLDPTLVSNLLVSIKSALTEEGEVAVDAAAADTAVGFVVALTKTNSFDMTRMMFVDSDKTGEGGWQWWVCGGGVCGGSRELVWGGEGWRCSLREEGVDV